jgi:hypothetical protein
LRRKKKSKFSDYDFSQPEIKFDEQKNKPIDIYKDDKPNLFSSINFGKEMGDETTSKVIVIGNDNKQKIEFDTKDSGLSEATTKSDLMLAYDSLQVDKNQKTNEDDSTEQKEENIYLQVIIFKLLKFDSINDSFIFFI